MPFVADPSLPANGENIGGGLGASRIRNITSWLLQFFGFSGTIAQTVAVPPFAPEATVGSAFATTGLLTLPANPVSALGIATKQYVDAVGIEATVIALSPGSALPWLGTLTPAITAYTFLKFYPVQWSGANIGNDTLNLGGGTLPVYTFDGGLRQLIAGEIPVGTVSLLAYDGAVFQIVNGPQQNHGTLYIGPGVGNWTVPLGVTTAIADLYGASGGGAGGQLLTGGGGGGAGAHLRLVLSGLTPGSLIPYVVGAGGTAGPGDGSGGNGVSTSFNGYVANAGFGGAAGTGGLGGVAQIGFGWVENDAGLSGGNASDPGGGFGGAGPNPGGNGAPAGTGNVGAAGYAGAITIQW